MTDYAQTPDAQGIDARFEPQRVRRLLSRHLPECRDRLEIQEVRTLGLRLKPGRECTGHLLLVFRDRRTGESRSQSALLHLTDVAPRPVIAPSALAAYTSLDMPIRTTEVELPELSAVLHPGALDPRLPALVEALDPQAMKPRLKSFLATDGLSLIGVRTRLISHTPGARATIRYRATVDDERGARRTVGLIGKLNAHDRLAPVMAENLALWRETSGAFQQARPLGVVEQLNLSLQTMIEGERLNASIATPVFPSHLKAVAEALACIHGAALPTERTRDIRREVKSVQNRGQILRAVSREPTRLDRLIAGLVDAIRERSEVLTPVHGDFHHANVMVNEAGIAVIDFDEIGYGDPGLDAARFPVSLSIPSLDAFGDLRLLAAGRRHFLPTYLDRTGYEAERVRPFEAIAFLSSAVTAWRLQRAGWETHMVGLLDLSEAALEQANLRPSQRCSPDSRAPAAAIDRRRWAAEPGYVALLIKPAVYRLHGAEVSEAILQKEVLAGETLRLGWRLRGATAEGSWRGVAAGVCRRGLRARAFERAIEHLRPAMSGEADALALPRVLAARSRLGLLLWDAEKTTPLDLSAGRPDGGDLARLARGLAALHRAELPEQTLRLPCPPDDAGASHAPVLSLRDPHPDHFGRAGDGLLLRRPERLCLDRPTAAVAALAGALEAAAGTAARRIFETAYHEAAGCDAGVLGTGRSGRQRQAQEA